MAASLPSSSLSPSDVLDFDFSRGIIRSKSGMRFFLNSSEAWIIMKEKMFESFSSGAASILFGIGSFYGEKAVEAAKNTNTDVANPVLVIRAAKKFGLQSGWGNITPRFERDELIVMVTDCCFCHNMKKRDEAVCYEFSGIISGALGKIMLALPPSNSPSKSSTISVKERKCKVLGDSVCEFSSVLPRMLVNEMRFNA